MPCQLFSDSITSLRPQGLCLFCSLLEMAHQCIFFWKKECTNKKYFKEPSFQGILALLTQAVTEQYGWLSVGWLQVYFHQSEYYFLEFYSSYVMAWKVIGVRFLISTKSCNIDQALLEFSVVLQSQPPKYWNYRHAPLCLANGGFLCGNADLNSEG